MTKYYWHGWSWNDDYWDRPDERALVFGRDTDSFAPGGEPPEDEVPEAVAVAMADSEDDLPDCVAAAWEAEEDLQAAHDKPRIHPWLRSIVAAIFGLGRE